MKKKIIAVCILIAIVSLVLCAQDLRETEDILHQIVKSAENLYKMGEYQAARDRLLQIDEYKDNFDVELLSDANLLRARINRATGNFDKAKENIKAAIKSEDSRLMAKNQIVVDCAILANEIELELGYVNEAETGIASVKSEYAEYLSNNPYQYLNTEIMALQVEVELGKTVEIEEQIKHFEPQLEVLEPDQQHLLKEKLKLLQIQILKRSDKIFEAIKVGLDFLDQSKSVKAIYKTGVVLNTAKMLMKLGRLDEAKTILRKASSSMDIKSINEVRVMMQKAKIAFIEGENVKLKEYLRSAYDYLVEVNDSNNLELYEAINMLGNMYQTVGEYQSAIETFELLIVSLLTRPESDTRYNKVKSDARKALTDLRVKLGSSEQPVEEYRQALALLANNASTVTDRVALYKRMALLAAKSSDGDDELQVIYQAENEIYRYLSEVGNDLSLEASQKLYKDGRVFLDLLLSKSSYSEKILSIVLRWKNILQRITATKTCTFDDEGKANKAKEILGEIQTKRRDLNSLLFTKVSKGSSEKNTSAIWDLKKRISLLSEKYSALCENDPFNQPTEITFEKLQSLIPEDTLFIDYIHFNKFSTLNETLRSEEFYSAIVLNKDKFRLIRLGNAAEIDELVHQYRNKLQQVNVDGEDLLKAGMELSKLIIKPCLAGYEKPKHLIFAPDGELHTLSFAALPSEEKGKYLIELNTVSYANSALDLKKWDSKPQKINSSGMLAVGNPLFAGKVKPKKRKDRSITPCMTTRWLRNLSPLPDTEKEIVNLTNIYKKYTADPLTVLMGSDATEENVLNLMPKYRYVHITTHGFFFSQKCFIIKNARYSDSYRLSKMLDSGEVEVKKPKLTMDIKISKHEIMNHPEMLSGIILSNPSINTDFKSFDNLLTAYELMNMDLSGVEFVSLAACQTGAGELISGLGVMGLKLALIQAGVRGFMLTLWSIPDDATFITAFYENLFDSTTNVGTAEAVRAASLKCIKSDKSVVRHPRNWAAYTYTGPLSQGGQN